MSRSVTRAVIVAAGLGRRLGQTKQGRPKPLLRVGNRTLLERSVDLLQQAGVAEILVVTGWGAAQIEDTLGDRATYALNPFYACTNNMASLWFARAFASGAPFVYLHADLIYHPQVLDRCLQADGPALALDPHPCGEEEMKVIGREELLVRGGKELPLESTTGEWIGMARFDAATSAALFDAIEAHLRDEQAYQAYDMLAFNTLTARGHRLRLVDCAGLPWVEIDFPQDLQRARRLFAQGGR